jgi:hypothetical protein
MSIILIISILLIPALAVQILFCRGNWLTINGLILGFFYFIIFITFTSIVIPEKLANTAIFTKIILCLSIIYLLYKSKKYIRQFNESWAILPLCTLFLVYAYCDLLNLRFHSSPDNHGFAAAVGYLSQNFSYDLLANKYHSITGHYLPKFDGPGGDYNGMTWSIADAQLRWTSETILTVGRIGLPLLGGLVASVSNPLNSFTIFLILLGLLGSFFGASLFIEIFKISYFALTDKKIQKNYIYSFFFTLLIALSNWQIIYILEGTVNQIWLIIGIQFHFFQLLKLLISTDFKCLDLKTKIIYLSAGPAFISIIYPHGFLLLFTLSIPLIFFLFISEIRYKSFKNTLIASVTLLACIPFTIFLLNYDTFITPLIMYANGVAGAPYNLGPATIFSYFAGTSYEWMPSVGTSYNLSGQSVLKMQYAAIIFTSLVGIIILSSFFINIKNRINLYVLTTIIFLLTAVIMKSVFGSKYLDYIYSRHCVVFVTIGLPITCAMLLNLFENIYSLKKMMLILSQRYVLLGILGLALINTTYDFYKFSLLFYSNSKPFNLLQSKEDLKKYKISKSIMVSKKPMHEIFSLSLLSPIYYITDDWMPIIKKDYFSQPEVDVYEVSLRENSIIFNKIGTITLWENIQGPINTDQLYKMNNFKPVEN